MTASNLIARNCENSYRFGLTTGEDGWSSDPPEPTGVEIYGCQAINEQDIPIAIDGYDVNIVGGFYELVNDDLANVATLSNNFDERTDEWGAPRVTFAGAGTTAGRVSYNDNVRGGVGPDWEMIPKFTDAVFRAHDEAGPVRLESPDIVPTGDRPEPQIQARDDAGPIYFESIRDETGDVLPILRENSTSHLVESSFGDLNYGDDETIVLEDYREPVDLTAGSFSPETGTQAWHDGSDGHDAGPYVGDGDNWIGYGPADGETI